MNVCVLIIDNLGGHYVMQISNIYIVSMSTVRVGLLVAKRIYSLRPFVAIYSAYGVRLSVAKNMLVGIGYTDATFSDCK